MAFNFINPYNFVPLSSGKSECTKQEDSEKLYTGVIDYSLLTKTPLFIPNTSNDHAIFPEEIKTAKNNKYHKSYEFYAYENLSSLTESKKKENLAHPVIPGSEIRGMLRSYYEILTNSCMSSIDDTILSRRSCHVFTAGLIKKTGVKKTGAKKTGAKEYEYALLEAEDCLLRTKGENNLAIEKYWKDEKEYNSRKCYIQKELKEGQKVYINTKPRGKAKKTIEKLSLKQKNGMEVGYVIKGEDGPNLQKDDGPIPKNQKHCCHVFLEKEAVIAENLDISCLDTVLNMYKLNGKGESEEGKDGSSKGNNSSSDTKYPYEEYAEQLSVFKNEGKIGSLFPVYYSVAVDGYYMLSPASITREIYKTTITDMLKSYRPCSSSEKLCPACALFGTVQTGVIKASCIRMTDLQLDTKIDKPEELYEEPVTLKELSSPKPGNMEFYMKKPKDAVFWTYDYYVDKDGNVHYEDKDGKEKSSTAEINGRKFYWHVIKANRESVSTNEKTIRNNSVRLLKPGIMFKGKVYFDKISAQQIEELRYLLECGEFNTKIDEKKNGYKLGTGKPLGLGSVALKVDGIQCRVINVNHETEQIICEWKNWDEYSSHKGFEPKKEIAENFRKITSFDALKSDIQKGYRVSYPRLEEDGEIFEWFAGNHKAWKLKEGKRVNNNMPNNRNQMLYEQYLTPMMAILSSTKENPTDKPTGKKYSKEKLYKGIVNGHNKSGRFAYVKLDEGGSASFRDPDKLSDGTKVTLKYQGKNSDGYNDWKRV